MDPKKLKRYSKFMSLVLRHRPAKAKLTLDPQGWVKVEDLLAGMAANGMQLDRAGLEEVVAENNKKRSPSARMGSVSAPVRDIRFRWSLAWNRRIHHNASTTAPLPPICPLFRPRASGPCSGTTYTSAPTKPLPGR